jgi:hypothetical protein
MTRKFTCDEVKKIIKEALAGVPMLELAKHYGVTDKTIANIVYRIFYVNCYSPLEDFDTPDEYFKEIREIVARNRRRAKGRRAK